MYYVNTITTSAGPVFAVQSAPAAGHVGASLTMDAACDLARQYAAGAAAICNQGSRAVPMDGALYAYAPGVRTPVNVAATSIDDIGTQLRREWSVSMVAHSYTIDADRYMTDDDALAIIVNAYHAADTDLPIADWLAANGAHSRLVADVLTQTARRAA